MLQYGKPPFLECKGRLSAPEAIFKSGPWKGRSIEAVYSSSRMFQSESGNVSGLSPSMTKGRKEIYAAANISLYRVLWRQYIRENPDLRSALKSATGISDPVGEAGRPSPATELWRIRNAPTK